MMVVTASDSNAARNTRLPDPAVVSMYGPPRVPRSAAGMGMVAVMRRRYDHTCGTARRRRLTVSSVEGNGRETKPHADPTRIGLGRHWRMPGQAHGAEYSHPFEAPQP